ncbi:methyl-accepting chemotaxis protein [Gammaproteobacteria bacterium]
MLQSFRNLSVAFKLNLVQGILMMVVIIAAAVFTTLQLHLLLEEKGVFDLRQMNHLIVAMLNAYDYALRSDIERTGMFFTQEFGQDFELVTRDDGTPQLVQGDVVSERLDIVDAFTARSGAIATIFVRQGNDFLRTATSVKKENGTRATGTLLGVDHPAHDNLIAGKSYTGKATLFGRDHMTHYLPVRDTAGKVIGAFFVGFDMSDSLKALKQNILTIKIGDTGYVYALDAGHEKGNLMIHPSMEGKNILAVKDSNGVEFVRAMIEKKTGVTFYDWLNPGERDSREKVVAYEHYPAWDWIIASGSYLHEFNAASNVATWDIVIMAIIIILTASMSGFWLSRIWVSRPLQDVMTTVDRIAAGHLDGTNLQVRSGDEVGRLTQAIATMAENLKTMIGNVSHASATMLDQSFALVASAEQVTRSSHAQSDAAMGMAASIEEMSVSIDQVEQHARDAQRISSVSGDTARQGGAVIEQAVAAMNQIASSVRETSATVGELGNRAQEISAVVQVIREIADQTNLLALNAAIEAARAGEQGRGFAVVADEVRKLAERTAKSTHSIGEMIGGIQKSANVAVTRMQEGVRVVEHGSGLADRAGGAISQIGAGTREVIDAVSGITLAISEQSIATQTIAQGVEKIAQMAEANHSVSQSTARAAQELRDIASKLDQELGYFHLS